MSKQLKPVNLKVETNIDADDLGSRITECIHSCTPDSNIVNLIKLYVDPTTDRQTLHYFAKMLKEALDTAGVINSIIVPLGKEIIDIKIDHLKIVEEKQVDVTEEY